MANTKLLTNLLLCVMLFFVSNVAHSNNAYVHAMTQNGAIACLTSAVFSEANLESNKDKEMVVVTILNRAVANDKHVCSVLKQKAQFSFYKAGYNWNKQALHKDSLAVVLDVLANSLKGRQSTYNNVQYFHANNVKPSWDWKKLQRVSKQSGHTFYKLKEN